jgi:2-oxoglutarate ferredoxin oxidoreductase subunit beta
MSVIFEAVGRALADLGIARERVVLVSARGADGDGTYAIEALPGRALSLATGVKLAKPTLEVVAVGEDPAAIALDDLRAACLRNPDLTCIVLEAAPLQGALLDVAIALRCSFVARAAAADPAALAGLVARAIRHEGFALLSVLAPGAEARPVGVVREERRPTCEEKLGDAESAARGLAGPGLDELAATFLP